MKRNARTSAVALLAACVFAAQAFAGEYTGVCYDGAAKSEKQLKDWRAAGINAISFSPMAYYEKENWVDISFATTLPRSMENDILAAKRLGFKIILRPMIGSRDPNERIGDWDKTIGIPVESEWQAWFKSYERMICHFAGIAQRLHVDLFVVGGNYNRATRYREREWGKMIRSVSAIYKGPLTYAADGLTEADTIRFWNMLDMIGVDANEPVGGYKAMLGLLSKRNGSKSILITRIKETDSESENDLADAPWISGMFLLKP